MSSRVIQATLADAETAARLLDDFNREFGDITPGPDVLADRLRRLLAAPTAAAFLADDPACAIAFVTLRPCVWTEGPVGMLEELYVSPERRNHGLGSELLAAAEAWVSAAGGEALQINVDGEDTDARRFYERHGYRDREPGVTESSLLYFREWSL